MRLDNDFAYLCNTALRYFIEQDCDNILQAFCLVGGIGIEEFFMVGEIGIEEFAAVGAKGIRVRHHVKDIIHGTRFFRQPVFNNLIKYLFTNGEIGHVYRFLLMKLPVASYGERSSSKQIREDDAIRPE